MQQCTCLCIFAQVVQKFSGPATASNMILDNSRNSGRSQHNMLKSQCLSTRVAGRPLLLMCLPSVTTLFLIGHSQRLVAGERICAGERITGRRENQQLDDISCEKKMNGIDSHVAITTCGDVFNSHHSSPGFFCFTSFMDPIIQQEHLTFLENAYTI